MHKANNEVVSVAVPKYNEFFSPVLRALEDGQIKRALEIRKYALNYLNVSEEDRKQMLPSNTQRLVDNRATWAITYLCKANLIERVAKGKYKITNTGIQVLHEKKDHVELKDLY